jgi:hypothetical protein
MKMVQAWIEIHRDELIAEGNEGYCPYYRPGTR